MIRGTGVIRIAESIIRDDDVDIRNLSGENGTVFSAFNQQRPDGQDPADLQNTDKDDEEHDSGERELNHYRSAFASSHKLSSSSEEPSAKLPTSFTAEFDTRVRPYWMIRGV